MSTRSLPFTALNWISGTRDGMPYYLNTLTGEESLSPPPLPSTATEEICTDERGVKRPRHQHHGGGGISGASSSASLFNALNFGSTSASASASASSSSSGGGEGKPSRPMLLHARTAPSASNNWVVGHKEGRDCFFNMITKEWTFTPPPMPRHAATAFAAASALDMAISPRLCVSPSDGLGDFGGLSVTSSPRSPLRMVETPREGGSVLDSIAIDDEMLLALESDAVLGGGFGAPPPLAPTPREGKAAQSAGEAEHESDGAGEAGRAGGRAAERVAAGAASVSRQLAAAAPVVAATPPAAAPALAKAIAKGSKATTTTTTAAERRRVKNREAANRCRQKKASRVNELELQVAQLEATVLTLRHQLAASGAANESISGQLMFLRGLLTSFAASGGGNTHAAAKLAAALPSQMEER